MRMKIDHRFEGSAVSVLGDGGSLQSHLSLLVESVVAVPDRIRFLFHFGAQ